MTLDLFDTPAPDAPSLQVLAPGALLLRGFVQGQDAQFLSAFNAVTQAAPLRHLTTPGGHTMSVGMTNCGDFGWVSSDSGYSYSAIDPQSGLPWPMMPPAWRALAVLAARQAAYDGFEPDACLVNQYASGAKMGLHQDRASATLPSPLCRCRWVCQRCFCLVGSSAQTRRSAFAWCMAMWWCGAGRHGWLFMVLRRWLKVSTRCGAQGAST